jgi:transcriptional regulator with XRE-family HTH domain
MGAAPIGHAGDMNRAELATFLRTRRDRLRPTDVGLPEGPGRRTPGLRRQEVAQLAGMSIDYYIRLEQARGPRPSKQVLGALSRALLLTADERAYLFRLADEAPPLAAAPAREVPHTVRLLLDTLVDTPAYVLDARYDVLAWNRLAVHFIGDMGRRAEDDRNVLRWTFTSPDAAGHWDDEQTVAFARSSVADLRAAAARYPDDPGIHALVAELRAVSPRFAAMWADHDVAVRRQVHKTLRHPVVGPIDVDCQVLHVPDADQKLVTLLAAPGSRSAAALRKLATLDSEAAGTIEATGDRRVTTTAGPPRRA